MQEDLFSVPVRELHRPGQTTSKAALEKTVKSRDNRQRRVYEALKAYGHDGAIPEELALRMGEELIDVRRCFSVLKKLGKIEFTGEERMNAKQHYCEVWRVLCQ